jgi:putative selenate reductase
MSGHFHPIPLPDLLRLALSETRNNRFMGITRTLFFRPDPADPFRMEKYDRVIETPIGVAAGPHTQLAQNIVAAWLCGARFIELKTVQTLDELDVSKPCIDMQDEGYNCEWSQELKIRQSFTEYLNAWILVHILHRELGFPGKPGILFNMSVGYNLEGILKENVQWFLDHMRDCSSELAEARQSILKIYPEIENTEIPSSISNHVTLSTMHGCPPEEIEKIGLYLVREKKLHTTIKLNPTLLGAAGLRELLNDKLGFTTDVPDLAFGHDLKYPDALRIIGSLQKASDQEGLRFGVKLTNTLESINNKEVFGADEKMMYMSGRALHPISIKVAQKLQNDFDGKLDISFSAGADCFNIADIIACGLKPVTVCSDLLKPGGYGRLYQYIENLRTEFASENAGSIDEFIRKNDEESSGSVALSALKNLNRYANRVAENPAYHKNGFRDPSIKTERPLGFFDCIHPPCVDTCPTHQDIPEYMYHVSKGDPGAALETIFRTNPFPSVTGMVCDHLCQGKCTRINYDESLRIREIKRFAALTPPPSPPLLAGEGPGEGYARRGGIRIAIIGAGPAGLSCAWYLRQAGCEVHIYEQKSFSGGMVSAAIPSFRLPAETIEKDIRRILDSGVSLHDNYTIDKPGFEKLKEEHDLVFLAAGAQRSARIPIPGIKSEGVVDPLEFLYQARVGKKVFRGDHVVIIGGGNTAMDAARTAYRMVGENGNVTIVYRRTIKEMPADLGEIKAVLQEGVKILELVSPAEIRTADGRVTAIVCKRNLLTMKGKDGRMIPVEVPGSEFEIPCDTVIPAIGQELVIDFIDHEMLKTGPGSYKTRIPGLYIGGDAMRGASTAINAIADGRKAAEEMLREMPGNKEFQSVKINLKEFDLKELLHRKALRQFGWAPAEISPDQRRNFDLVTSSLSEDEAIREASRCLLCDEICNVCVSVCPNLANFSYTIEPVQFSLQKAVLQENDTIAFVHDAIYRISQPFQILNIRDFCNECGNCTTFCPSSGSPYKDKPGICLTAPSLNAEEKGYFLNRTKEKTVLVFKEKENIKTLTLVKGNYIYETDQVRAVIAQQDFRLLEVTFLTPCVKEYHFPFAAEMSIILRGAIELNNLLTFDP